MEISHARGKAFGIPANGTVVNINDADVGAITSSASGLTKSLLTVGKVGIVAATTLGLCYLGLRAISSSHQESVAGNGDVKKLIFSQGNTLVSSLANASTLNRKFTGICLNERIKFVSEGHKFDIPLDYVTRIYHVSIFFYERFYVHVFDGGVYETKGISLEATDLTFFTILGKQTIKFKDFLSGSEVFSSTIEEKKMFVKQLTDHLNRKSDDLVKLLGKKDFEKYFYQE